MPTPEEEAELAAIDARIDTMEKALTAPDERLDAMQREWEQALATKFDGLEWASLVAMSTSTANGAELSQEKDSSFRVSGPNPDQEVYEITFRAEGPVRSFKLDLFTDESLPGTGPGRSENGNVVVSEFQVERAPAEAPEQKESLPVMDAVADFAQERDDYQVVYAIDGKDDTGWATGSHVRRENRTAIFVLDETPAIQNGDWVTVRIKHTSPYRQHAMGRFKVSHSGSGAVSQWARPNLGTWHHVGPFPLGEDTENSKLIGIELPPEKGFDQNCTYGDSQLRWVAKPEWKDGKVHQFEQAGKAAQYLYRTIHLEIPQKLVFSLGSNDAIKVWVDGTLRLLTNEGRTTAPDQDRIELYLPEGEHELVIKIVNYGGGTSYYFKSLDDGGQSLLATMKTLATPADQRSVDDREQLRLQFRGQDPEWLASRKSLDQLQIKRKEVLSSVTTTMVMEDVAEKRDTYLLKRGAYDAPDTSEKLYPSVPERLGEMDPALPANRLGLAKWLVDPRHPLTARVRVNHYWQMYFGKGIVKTAEDFGTQGARPSHPELLDWLAIHFVRIRLGRQGHAEIHSHERHLPSKLGAVARKTREGPREYPALPCAPHPAPGRDASRPGPGSQRPPESEGWRTIRLPVPA